VPQPRSGVSDVDDASAAELIIAVRIPVIQARIDGSIMGRLGRLLEDLKILSNDSRLAGVDPQAHNYVGEAWTQAATAHAHLVLAVQLLDAAAPDDAPRHAGLLEPTYR